MSQRDSAKTRSVIEELSQMQEVLPELHKRCIGRLYLDNRKISFRVAWFVQVAPKLVVELVALDPLSTIAIIQFCDGSLKMMSFERCGRTPKHLAVPSKNYSGRSRP